ncbi:MAG: hypothetical protein ACE5IW_11710 [bacterium]
MIIFAKTGVIPFIIVHNLYKSFFRRNFSKICEIVAKYSREKCRESEKTLGVNQVTHVDMCPYAACGTSERAAANETVE